MILYFSIFKGSVSDDFQSDADLKHPFEPCPGTPNCAIYSIQFSLPAKQLFQAASISLKQMAPHKKKVDSQQLQINSVFRIPVFGFKDDVNVAVESADSEKSVLHIKSYSRLGRSDLGVNRRRVKRFIKKLQNNL